MLEGWRGSEGILNREVKEGFVEEVIKDLKEDGGWRGGVLGKGV